MLTHVLSLNYSIVGSLFQKSLLFLTFYSRQSPFTKFQLKCIIRTKDFSRVFNVCVLYVVVFCALAKHLELCACGSSVTECKFYREYRIYGFYRLAKSILS